MPHDRAIPMQLPEAITRKLAEAPRHPRIWLITGAAGFIGSNLVESLLRLDQEVVGLDNFATGSRANLDEIEASVTPAQWGGFRFIEADVAELDACRAACKGVTIVLHQAALGSVPRSIENPLATHAANVTGHLNMLIAASECGVDRFIYASSSSVYGDAPTLPQTEDALGRPLSPYAAGKRAAELYAAAFARCYGLRVIGLRYFNVFGPRQGADGPYAGVIPRWTRSMIVDEPIVMYGDGSSSRDFCYVENVVQANLRAALIENESAFGEVCNIATGSETSLGELHGMLRARVAGKLGRDVPERIERCDPRKGDLAHSLADISRARRLLGYGPSTNLAAGLDATVAWHCSRT